jgi:hypothetical protein
MMDKRSPDSNSGEELIRKDTEEVKLPHDQWNNPRLKELLEAQPLNPVNRPNILRDKIYAL